jgi:hypothetical protein
VLRLTPPSEPTPNSRDNRLLFTLKRDLTESPPNDVIERTDHMYSYYNGNVMRTVTRPAIGTAGVAEGTWFIYDAAQQLRGLIAGEWDVDPNGVPEGYNKLTANCDDVLVVVNCCVWVRYAAPKGTTRSCRSRHGVVRGGGSSCSDDWSASY